MAAIEWIKIEGGLCQFSDRMRPLDIPSLWWSRTHVTQAQCGRLSPDANPDLPTTLIDFETATQIAIDAGGRLPSSAEWEWMAGGPERRAYPWGDSEWADQLAALAPLKLKAPCTVGAYPAGDTPEGMQDVAGNVWEWTSTRIAAGGAYIRGGSYASRPIYARTGFRNAAPVELRSAGIGFRIVRPV